MIEPVVARDDSPIVVWCNHDHPHIAGKVMSDTCDAYVVMLFHTPFQAKTVNGIETGEAGQMLINPPGRRQWHRGVEGQGFRNDWLHLAEDAVGNPIEQLNLPIDQIFSVSNTRFVGRIIEDCRQDVRANAPDRNEVTACRVTELLLMIRRYSRIARKAAESPVEQAHYERLCSIRDVLHEEFAKPWRLETMAAMANLSRNRFAVLYKKFFGISPIDDVINIRVQEARWLLSHGLMTMTEVAEACGYDSLNYFSRHFKSRTGKSPREYRNG